MGSWRIELSRSAVAVLRSLPREEQRCVAARIRQLEESGPPDRLGGPRPFDGKDDPNGPGGGDGIGGVVLLVRAGSQTLMCVVDEEKRGIVVITLGSDGAPLPALVERVARRWIHSWTGGGGMGTLTQDLRFALRSLRRSAGFTITAVLTLGLGIGAATAIYSVADGVILEPLPYGDPDRVATIWARWINFPDRTWLSEPEFQLLHQETQAFEDMALYQLGSATFTTVESPERVGAAQVTPNMFAVLRTEPVAGRAFTWEEARNEASVALIAHETWQRRWNGDPSLIGSTVEIDGGTVTILGVMPPGFILPADYGSSSVSEVFQPLWTDLDAPATSLDGGGNHGAYAVGRLQDGRTVEDARADVARVFEQNVEHVGLYAPEVGFAFRVFGAKDDIVGSARATIMLLLGAVALVLLIACGNVANLLLSRSDARIREMSLRTALGAGRRRILRQLLTESVVLALMGGALGIGVAAVGVPALLAVDPSSVPRSASVSMDASVLLFALGGSLLTALVFGMAPAVRVIRESASAAARESRGRVGASSRAQGLLVAGQMAMAVILLTASTLMIRTFVSLLEVDPGFHAKDVLTFRITAPEGSYPGAESVVTFYRELQRELGEIPGIREIGAARLLPLASTMGDAGVSVEGYAPAPNESTQAEWQYVTPGYLELMHIPLLSGRTVEEGDGPDAQDVVVVSRSMARHYWGDRDPLGGRVRVLGATAVVVGVVGDVAHNELTGTPREAFYRPHTQTASRSLTFTLATEGEPLDYLASVRSAVRGIDPTMPVAEARTLDDVLASARASQRFAAMLLGTFAGIALALALVGIYGVISYAVSRRRSEIGIRMALGAEARTVVRMVVRQGMVTAMVGVVAGTLSALLLSRLMEGMLYGVEPQDAATFMMAPALFAVVALMACWIPAARAAHVHPAEALRSD